MLNSKEHEGLIGRVDSYMTNLKSKKTNFRNELGKLKGKHCSIVDTNQSGTIPRMLVVKRLDNPTFSGDIRDFPNLGKIMSAWSFLHMDMIHLRSASA